MDLEVVGRHALLFDDDTNASFVNSPDALVEWHSLFIDRYDVRHLLSSPPPPRTRRRNLTRSSSSPPPHPDATLESELDRERYLDLPSPSEEQEQDTGNDAELADTGGYHSVAFSYGNPDEFTEQKNNDAEPEFRPAFPVPESLIQHLPPTEKIHQIIARTATFVATHGGQSEIVLRVKQGDNPMFGFLMPDHHLHAYFRFLVDHQELLKHDGKSLEEEKKTDGRLDQTGGALSLLGSVYGSGEDEDGVTEDAPELRKVEFDEAVNAISGTVPHGSEQMEFSGNLDGKNDIVSKIPCPPLKEKVNIIKRNRTISTVKGGATSGLKKESDASGSLFTVANNKSQVSAATPSASKVELPILEPPSDQKRVVEKIVEFILKNGREFEAVLVEQDRKHGRFLFLLPSNYYHPYYLKVLQQAQESKLHGKGLVSEKHEPVGHVVDKKTAKEGDTHSSGSAGHDIPFDYDRKEKFKMVIGKAKKDVQDPDPPSKALQQQGGVSLDAAAAILQAATRGIKNPGLEIFPKPSSSVVGQGSSNEGRPDFSSGSLHTSKPQNFIQKADHSGEPNIPVPVAKAIAETAALAAASEADSSEASLTREQKLKTERLKRAKMFAAMIKSGSAPMKAESLRGLSVEPPESGVSSSGNEVVNLAAKEREGSSVPFEVNISDKVEEFEKRYSVDECNERRLKRTYRTKSKRHEGEEEGDDDKEQEEEEEDKRGHRHSRKKRRSHRSSDHSRDRHKHKRHSSSKDTDFRRHHKQDSSSDEKHRHSRRSCKNNSSDDEHQPQERHKHDSYSDDEHWHSKHEYTHGDHQNSRHKHKHSDSSNDEHHHLHRNSRRRHKHSDSSDDEHHRSQRRHMHDISSEDEHRHRSRSLKHRKPKSEKVVELEEGEICTKSDQSRASEGDNASRETSVDFSKSNQIGRAPSLPSGATEVSDDLRAKIRAMLMATL